MRQLLLFHSEAYHLYRQGQINTVLAAVLAVADNIQPHAGSECTLAEN